MWIGFCLSDGDPYTVIDMDNKECRLDYAEQIIGTCDILKNTLIERSISGLGYHAWLRGSMIGSKNKKAPFEFYSGQRFVITTGDIINNAPISDAYQDWLQAAAEWLGPSSERSQLYIDCSVEATSEELQIDEQLLGKFHTFKNVASIEYWFNAQDFEDPSNNQHSENDARLMQFFYKFNQGRPERDRATVRMFLRSPRAHYLTRKSDPQQYVARTLNDVKNKVDREESPIVGLSGAVGAFQNGHIISAPIIGPMQARLNGFQFLNQQLPSFITKSANEVRLERGVDWIVKDVVQMHTVSILYGWSGVGKSFLLIDLMCSIAQGKPWTGCWTRPVHCLYLALEGHAGIGSRLEAYRLGHEMEQLPDNVDIYRGGFNLLNDAEVLGMIHAQRAAGHIGGVVIIDTLARAILGADENSSSDMGRAIGAAEKISRELQATIILAHHTGKDKEGGPRGSSSLTNNPDGQIRVYIEEGSERRCVTTQKVREGASGKEPWSFTLGERVVGYLTRPDGMQEEVKSQFVIWDNPAAQDMSRFKKPDAHPWDTEDNRERAGSARESRKTTHQTAILQAIGMLSGESRSREVPEDDVVKRALEIRQPANISMDKRDLKRALVAMSEHKKIGHKVVNGKGLVWLMS
jgi:hypothetical protein